MAHLDEPQQGEAPGEDTNVFVKNMLEGRKKSRRPVMIGVGIAVVLLTLMALNWGSRRHEELEIMGPVYTPRSHGAAAEAEPQQQKVAAAEAPKPVGPPVDVDLVLEKGGNLMVDGRDMGGKEKGGKERTEHLQLAPGAHTVTVRQAGRVLTQKITVAPKESYEIKFGQKIRVMKETQ